MSFEGVARQGWLSPSTSTSQTKLRYTSQHVRCTRHESCIDPPRKCLRGFVTKRYQHVQREAACVFTGRSVVVRVVFYLDFPCMVGNDEAQQYDCRQADQTLQGQRIHGALGREELTRTLSETCRGKKTTMCRTLGFVNDRSRM